MTNVDVWVPAAEYKCLTFPRQSPLQTGERRHKQLLTMRENLWTSLIFMLMLIISSAFSFIIGKEHVNVNHKCSIESNIHSVLIETPEQMSKIRGETRTKRYEMLRVE